MNIELQSNLEALNVAIDARLVSGTRGGVEQFIIGLASGLSRLTDGNEEYLFLTNLHHDDWLKIYLHGNCRLIYTAAKQIGHTQSVRNPQSVFDLPRIVRKVKTVVGKAGYTLPESDGTVEGICADVMHFTMQTAFVTNIPFIYQPWDLQHLHLPQYFRLDEYKYREFTYRRFCEQASMVVVASQWAKRDLITNYALSPEKVKVIPVAPVFEAYRTPNLEVLAALIRMHNLPDRFIFYPAQTWPHKNHLRLLDALSILKTQYGIKIPLISTGRQNEFFSVIQNHLTKLHLNDQVKFLGFVSPEEVQSIYNLCYGLVFPSEFEGWGMPVTEAFMAGVPVACSNVTSLPDLVGDAALLFDPTQPQEIAEAIRQLWTDEHLRQKLIIRGRNRVSQFDWKHIACIYRAIYRRMAGKNFSAEDALLLAEASIDVVAK